MDPSWGGMRYLEEAEIQDLGSKSLPDMRQTTGRVIYKQPLSGVETQLQARVNAEIFGLRMCCQAGVARHVP
jgi:hypothetical protein